MKSLERFIENFDLLGKFLGQFPAKSRSNSPELADLNSRYFDSFTRIIQDEHISNPWFTQEWLELALEGIAAMLEKEILERWLSAYDLKTVEEGDVKTIGLVMAGNIPLVGFHDLLCVLATGNRVLAKLSSKDDRLIRKVTELIELINPELGTRIVLSDENLKGMDAVIATGSNNSARYFEYYFRKLPYIIRKNRNGVAVLTGRESEEELLSLGRDIFTYFGMGCRNVSKLYIPEDYDLKNLLRVLDSFESLCQHHKYANNVDYHRSIYLMNLQEFLDNGVLLLKEDHQIASPVGVVYYERYADIPSVKEELSRRKEEIQCCITILEEVPGHIRPGESQRPFPWEYADGLDTITFLSKL